MKKLIQTHRELLDQLEAMLSRSEGVKVTEVAKKVIELDGNHSDMVQLCLRKLEE